MANQRTASQLMAPMTHSYGCHSCPILCGLHSNTCPHCTVPNSSQLMMLLSLSHLPYQGVFTICTEEKRERWAQCWVLPALDSHRRIPTYWLCDPGQVSNISELQPLCLSSSLSKAGTSFAGSWIWEGLLVHSFSPYTSKTVLEDSEGEWPTRALWGSGGKDGS